ncbi:phage tail tape measure protein [Thermodesulfovibrio thiophilus]|uniref:phage tail tape measure protein n=1 Tax=Thermodesulfovibrio thiophilus TaxID=340095 RepID=UPI00040EE01F|nr:phage tail tape measure protein [Thermodesulfovibrio thiophilus]
MENIFSLAILFKAVDNVTASIRNIQNSTKVLSADVERATSKFKLFGEKIKSLENTATSFQSMVGAAAWTGAFAGTMKSFGELEDASLSLKSTFMEAGGVIPEVFQQVDSEAKKLGAELPGTSADFYKLASVMRQLGIEGDVLANGGLRSAAYLGAVLKIPYEEAGFYVAKFSQALGISQKDLEDFMDVVQRLGHLGVNASEMQYSFSKLSGALKILGWQGLEVSKQLAPIVGRFVQLGYSGETVGHNLSNLFLAFLDSGKLDKFNKELSQYGIHLDAIDKKTGQIKKPEELIAEIDKISQAYKRGILSQSELFEALSKLTGAGGEDLKMLATLVTEGIEGYNQMNEAMAKQASLTKRIETVSSSLRNVWEAFTGTAQNLFALIGSSLAPALKGIATTLNYFTDMLSDFFEEHKTLASILGWTVGILAGVSGGFVALGIVITALLFPLRIFLTTIQIVGPVLSGLTILIKTLSRTAITAIASMSKAMFTTPVGWVIMGIIALVAAGYLLWRNWDKVSKALVSAWNWLKENWGKILGLFLWINPITAPIKALNELYRKITGMSLFDAGRKLIETLLKGILSVAAKPVEAVKAIAQKIRNLLPFSPAREGPLSQLHRIKLIETIAQSIKPAPLLTALKQTFEPMKAIVQPLFQPIKQTFEPMKAAGVSGVNITVNLGGVNITGQATEKEAKDIVSIIQKEVERTLSRIETAKFRRSY